MKIIGVVTLCLVAMFQSALADTYTCDAVRDEARLRYDGISKVSVIGKDRICSFAVGEESVDNVASSTDVNQEQFKLAHDEFINLIREAASLHGERGNFVQNILGGSDIRPPNCGGGSDSVVDGLRIDCTTIESSDGYFIFESAPVTAHMARPRFVVSIVSTVSSESQSASFDALYVFVLMQ